VPKRPPPLEAGALVVGVAALVVAAGLPKEKREAAGAEVVVVATVVAVPVEAVGACACVPNDNVGVELGVIVGVPALAAVASENGADAGPVVAGADGVGGPKRLGAAAELVAVVDAAIPGSTKRSARDLSRDRLTTYLRTRRKGYQQAVASARQEQPSMVSHRSSPSIVGQAVRTRSRQRSTPGRGWQCSQKRRASSQKGGRRRQ
jgi:hypothetical protein